jgi:hypothetical protein
MLPAFDEFGNLPPGFHRCTLEEVAARYGHGSPEREVETAELARFVMWARQAGVARILVDGSYITSEVTPNDIDLVILPGPGYPAVAGTARGAIGQWPFLHVQIAADTADLEQWARVEFGKDRDRHPKGIVEIVL